MTENDKHGVVGRVLTEKKDAENHLAYLHAEASRLGEMLESLGRTLRERPDMVTFENQGVDMKYLSRNKPLFKAAEVDGNKLVSLTSEIRETVEKIDRLKTAAHDLGF